MRNYIVDTMTSLYEDSVYQCTKCFTAKHLDEYYTETRSNGRTYKHSQCKKCENKARTERRRLISTKGDDTKENEQPLVLNQLEDKKYLKEVKEIQDLIKQEHELLLMKVKQEQAKQFELLLNKIKELLTPIIEEAIDKRIVAYK